MSVQKVLLSSFQCKPRPSGVSLVPGTGKYPLSCRKSSWSLWKSRCAQGGLVYSVSLKAKWGYIRALKLETERSKSFAVCILLRTKSIRSLESPRLQNFPQVPANRVQGCQNHGAPKVVSATLWVLKWSGAIFRTRSSKVSIQKVLLCPLHYKPRPSGVSLEFPGLGIIPQVPGNRAEVGQNYDARNAVSGTLWVLNLNGVIFRPRSSKVSVQKIFLCAFQCKPRPSGVSLESSGLENIHQIPGNRAQVCQNNDAREAVSATL